MKEAFELFDRAGSGASNLSPRPAARLLCRPRSQEMGASSGPPLLSRTDAVSRSGLVSHRVLVGWFAGKISGDDFGTVVRAVGLNPTEADLSGAGGGDKVRQTARDEELQPARR